MNLEKPSPVVPVGQVTFAQDRPIAVFAGPCQMESRAHALEMATALKEIAVRLNLGLVYKTSFDKANRTSFSGKRGIGLEDAIPVFAEIREKLGLPIVTDVHEIEQCARVAPVVDVLQIPAFLCRQTDLLVAAARTGKVIKIKKGQFLAPWGYAERRRQGDGEWQSQRARHRARRLVRLQHAGRRHALARDYGRDRRAGDLRRDAFGAAAGRPGHVDGR
jgi:3-deoxy-D-manno-octulosonic acid (KDO) 8-phosphate synthase